MGSKIVIGIMLFLIALMPGALPSVQAIPSGTTGEIDQSSQTSVVETYARLPMLFIHNQGQLDSQVEYYVKTPGQTVYLTPSGMVFDLVRYRNTVADLTDRQAERLAFSLDFVGANTSPLIEGSNKDGAVVNYLIGNDPQKWHTDISTYREVVYKDIYPGIDLRLYGKADNLEYAFVVQPGANVCDIALAYAGIDSLVIKAGELVASTAFGDLKQTQPYIYQQIADDRLEIEGGFELLAANTYGFEVAAYDAGYPLVIDPGLVYSTYLGGSDDDYGYGIAVDSTGCAYVTGKTGSADFPTQDGYLGAKVGDWDAFVTKLNSTGDNVTYSTYLGGSNEDAGNGIAVDASGNAYVTGYTDSADFPTWNQFQADETGRDAFVTKLNAAGNNLLYSTYLGGYNEDVGNGIDVSLSMAYVTGYTDSADFPTRTPYETDDGIRDAFVTNIDTNVIGNPSLIYSTYLGGSGSDYGNGIAVESGCAYVTGYTLSTDFPTLNPYQTYQAGCDAFVTKFNNTGNGLIYSTYLGGSGNDYGNGIAVESGCAYITGYTGSTDFPVTASAYQGTFGTGGSDALFTRLNSTGDNATYSTYLGGTDQYDRGYGIAVDALGCAYVTGVTYSNDFPVKCWYQESHMAGDDAFVTKFNPTRQLCASLLYSTYLCGSSHDYGRGIAVDSAGCAYVTGYTLSSNFPVENEYQTNQPGNDAFVTKFDVLAPTVTTDNATSVEETTATLNGTLDGDGGEACEYLFVYDTDSGEPYAHQTSFTGCLSTDDTFFENITGLNKGTKYYFKAFSQNTSASVPGDELTFTTKPDGPTDLIATAVSSSQIDLSWTPGDGAQKTMVRRSDSGYPTAPDDDDEAYFGNGTGTSDTGLTPETTYYYSAWSQVAGSDVWSDGIAQNTATTQEAVAPTVTLVDPDNGIQGDTLIVTITGTDFTDVTEVDFGADITDNGFNVVNSTQISDNITIAANAALGARDVSVTTSEGTGTLTAGFTVIGAPLPSVVGDYSIKGSIKFYDWKCNKWIVVNSGSLHITSQDENKIQGYFEPGVTIEGWPSPLPMKGYVGPFERDAKGKVKNKPQLSLVAKFGTYCEYPDVKYVTYIINGDVKWDKKTNTVKSIKCTINGWGELSAAFDDGSPSVGQLEGKFTATPIPDTGIPMPEAGINYIEYATTAIEEPGLLASPAGAAATPMVSAGGYHTVGLKSNGTVVATSWNDEGQCDVGSWTDITQVSAGGYHTVGLKSNGTVVAVGLNDEGQCNVDSWTDITQVDAGWWHTVGLKQDGSVVATGRNDEGQCDVTGWTDNITQVSAGGLHTVGLKTDHTVVAVGWNYYDQCTDVGPWTDITQVSAGGYHTVGLVNNGTVLAVGRDDYDQCSNVSTWTDISQVSAGGYHTVGLVNNGSVLAVGDNEDGQCNVTGWTGITQVSAGAYHTVGLGSVVATGNNAYGQCDVDDWNLETPAIPAVVGDYSIKGSIKFFDWKGEKWIVLKSGTLHITEQYEHKIKGYFEPGVTIEGWPAGVPVEGYVGPFTRDAKDKIKNKPRLSLMAELGTYCEYPDETYVTYITNGAIKWDKKTDTVKSIKCTINGFGEFGTAFPDGSASQGQFEGKFTATPVP